LLVIVRKLLSKIINGRDGSGRQGNRRRHARWNSRAKQGDGTHGRKRTARSCWISCIQRVVPHVGVEVQVVFIPDGVSLQELTDVRIVGARTIYGRFPSIQVIAAPKIISRASTSSVNP